MARPKPYDHNLKSMNLQQFQDYCHQLAQKGGLPKKQAQAKPLTPLETTILQLAKQDATKLGYVQYKKLLENIKTTHPNTNKHTLNNTLNRLRELGELPRTTYGIAKKPAKNTPEQAQKLVRGYENQLKQRSQDPVKKALWTHRRLWSGLMSEDDASDSLRTGINRAAELYDKENKAAFPTYAMNSAKWQLTRDRNKTLRHASRTISINEKKNPDTNLTIEDTLGQFNDPNEEIHSNQLTRQLLQLHRNKILTERELLTYYLNTYHQRKPQQIARAMALAEGTDKITSIPKTLKTAKNKITQRLNTTN